MGWFASVNSVTLCVTIQNDGKTEKSVNLIFQMHYGMQVYKWKKREATWLKLTRDFEAAATLLSEQHMCEKETEISVGGGVIHKQKREPRLQY